MTVKGLVQASWLFWLIGAMIFFVGTSFRGAGILILLVISAGFVCYALALLSFLTTERHTPGK